ncbi:MAG: prepilin-type N-terminal cleavage/methylation domain-containing protein [bacterium]|nr:prepilin-type N-terminal cleavage/methylation domain-containing protein [bacterium]
MNKKGFTLMEVLIILAILLILLGISITVFISLGKRYDLNNTAELMADKLRLARERTIASEGDNQYGIYFDTATSPDRYILFRGASFSSRDPNFDEVYDLPKSIDIANINFNNNEAVFKRLTGDADAGDILLSLSSDPGQMYPIYINSFGQIGFNPFFSGSDENRLKDFRHIHFKYAREIGTSEILTLTFGEGAVSENISVLDFLQAGNLNWEGEIDVDGNIQKIEVKTINGLNEPDMEFCIHRDRESNNKSLNVSISGDLTGNLAEFSADGQVAGPTSIYVFDFERK